MTQARGGAVTGVESGDLDGIVGLGHDVVALDAFAEQLEEPGGGMRRLFSPRELRQSALRGRLKADGEAVHLAARWAGKSGGGQSVVRGAGGVRPASVHRGYHPVGGYRDS